jgi:hypothetical protein
VVVSETTASAAVIAAAASTAATAVLRAGAAGKSRFPGAFLFLNLLERLYGSDFHNF